MVIETPKEIVLSCSNGTITLKLEEGGIGGWYQVHLTAPGINRPLGAGVLKKIVSRLVSFLEATKPGLHNVLNLSELHTSAYGEHMSGEVVLHFQDKDAKMFARLAITEAEKNQWIRVLKPYRDT